MYPKYLECLKGDTELGSIGLATVTAITGLLKLVATNPKNTTLSNK